MRSTHLYVHLLGVVERECSLDESSLCVWRSYNLWPFNRLHVCIHAQAELVESSLFDFLSNIVYCVLCVGLRCTHWINFAFLFLASSSPFGRDRIEWRPGPQHSLPSSFLEPNLWRDPATEVRKMLLPNVINVSNAELSNITKRPKF
jgi:hypothetical protein